MVKRRTSRKKEKHGRACCTCKNLQLRPRTSYLSNWDISRKPSEANTMGLSGRLGSQMQKFCAASQSLRTLGPLQQHGLLASFCAGTAIPIQTPCIPADRQEPSNACSA